MKKIIVLITMFLLLAGVSLATITSSNPSGVITTSDNSFNFTAITDNPLLDAFRTPITYMDLAFNESLEMDCSLSGSNYLCSLYVADISGIDGIYEVNMTDGNGTFNVGNMTVDHSITANSFGFVASANNINYTSGGCVDLLSGVKNEVGQWSNDSWTTTYNFTGTGVNLTDGSYDVKGFCEDNAGNTAVTSVSSFVLPSSPPVLTTVTNLPSSVICGTPASFPCLTSVDGGGSPTSVSLKLTFDKISNITMSLDGGAESKSTNMYLEHVVSLTSLMDGMHNLSITATDGTNQDNFMIRLNTSNTSGNGSINISIRESIPVVSNASIGFIGTPTVLKNNILPGDFAIVNYSLFMVKGNYTKYSFSGSSDFMSPVLVFCENNYNPTTKDVINSTAAFSISVLNGQINESKYALTCPYTSGNLNDGLYYNVIVKYPISSSTTSSSLAGSLGVSLYNTTI